VGLKCDSRFRDTNKGLSNITVDRLVFLEYVCTAGLRSNVDSW